MYWEHFDMFNEPVSKSWDTLAMIWEHPSVHRETWCPDNLSWKLVTYLGRLLACIGTL
jgi:hypothetical protein